MTTPKNHRRRVFSAIAPLLAAETLPLVGLLDAPRRLLADVVSPIDVPGFDNSSMDGYAVAGQTLRALAHEASATGGDLRLGPIAVRGRVAAGDRGQAVAAGTAVEIMTGAPLPPGTDTIIRIEDTSPGHFESEQITVTVPADRVPETGTFVRTTGSDVEAGQRVLSADTLLTPAHLGVAAACGVGELTVATPPRVLVVSTGDEITAEAAAGIHDANSITLSASLARLGVEAEVLTVPDDPRALLDRVAAAEAELVISTGGISKGAREVVKLAADLDPESAMVFEAIGMQPGGPQGCGRMADRAWVALPGNPVSALISFEMFIRPALLGLSGDEPPRAVEFHPLAQPLDEAPPAGKLQIRRARLRPEGLELVGGSRSHLLHSYAQSTHLVFFPPADTDVQDSIWAESDPFAPDGDRLRTWKIR